MSRFTTLASFSNQRFGRSENKNRQLKETAKHKQPKENKTKHIQPKECDWGNRKQTKEKKKLKKREQKYRRTYAHNRRKKKDKKRNQVNRASAGFKI